MQYFANHTGDGFLMVHYVYYPLEYYKKYDPKRTIAAIIQTDLSIR